MDDTVCLPGSAEKSELSFVEIPLCSPKAEPQKAEEKRAEGGIENANCMAHARRHFANAVKAMGKKNEGAVRSSIAYQALVHIGAFYDLEKGLKELPPKEREKERKTSIEPLIEAYFAWVKKTLREGKVPIDNSVCERALRNFTIGRKNWVIMNTVRGAQASAMIYSVTETARANDLNVYYPPC